MLRITQILLVLSVAVWGLLGGFSNLMGYAGGLEMVASVLRMDGIDPQIAGNRPVHSIWIAHLGLGFIYAGKFAAGGFCAWAVWRMLNTRAGEASDFARAKRPAWIGCGLGMLMLYGGFIVIAGGWFDLWRTEGGQMAHSFAFQYMGALAFVALFLNVSDD